MARALPGWVAELRARNSPPGRTAFRTIVSAFAVIAGAAAIASIPVRPRPLLLWNASASSPEGLYGVRSADAIRAGDMAVAWPPPRARRLAAQRHYLPAAVPLVKRAAAAAGDRICAAAGRVTINGRLAAIRWRQDSSGRLLPRWTGCVVLGAGDVFLLGTAGPPSFDGRYFGISKRATLVGKATLLWPR